MKLLNIAIVGGGSFLWGPLFLRDLLIAPALQGSTIVLHDLDPQALDLVFTLGQKLIALRRSTCVLKKTLVLDEALSGADAVLLTISTGGLEAMRADLEIPEKYGIYQSVGDTVGPGGLARGLRNIPVVVGIGRKMAELCPQAWLLNYTNPMSTLCRAVARTSPIKTVGLCHSILEVQPHLLALLGAPRESDLQLRVGGINHLSWFLQVQVGGKDAFAELHALIAQKLSQQGEGDSERDERSAEVDRNLIKYSLFQIYDAFPAIQDRHLAEFFPFFLSEKAGRGGRYGIARTTVEERYRWRAEEEASIHRLIRGEEDVEEFLAHASDEAAAEILSAMARGEDYRGIVNLPNRGQIEGLPAGAIVETLGVMEPAGARGQPLGELPPGVFGVVSRHVSNQEMIVEAALTGDRKLALQALVNDPLVTEIHGAEKMLDEMMLANRQYLPQFFDNATRSAE